jgi:hypothetical protein
MTSDERGQIAVLALGLALVVFAIAGLAVDGTRAFLARRSLQNLADAAALAGAGELDTDVLQDRRENRGLGAGCRSPYRCNVAVASGRHGAGGDNLCAAPYRGATSLGDPDQLPCARGDHQHSGGGCGERGAAAGTALSTPPTCPQPLWHRVFHPASAQKPDIS